MLTADRKPEVEKSEEPGDEAQDADGDGDGENDRVKSDAVEAERIRRLSQSHPSGFWRGYSDFGGLPTGPPPVYAAGSYAGYGYEYGYGR